MHKLGGFYCKLVSSTFQMVKKLKYHLILMSYLPSEKYAARTTGKTHKFQAKSQTMQASDGYPNPV